MHFTRLQRQNFNSLNYNLNFRFLALVNYLKNQGFRFQRQINTHFFPTYLQIATKNKVKYTPSFSQIVINTNTKNIGGSLLFKQLNFQQTKLQLAKKTHQIFNKPPIGLPNNKNPNMATHQQYLCKTHDTIGKLADVGLG